MKLAELANDPHATIDEIGAFLDRLDRAAVVDEMCHTTRGSQRSLYEKASKSSPLCLADFAGDVPIGQETIHEGVNTLPLIAPLRRFQKRFCQPHEGAAQLFGYNEGVTRRLLGPGYFVAQSTVGRPQWEARGAVVIDYFQMPEGPVPATWPPVVPNSRGLQRFVFRGTRDFMRRVSRLVTIGAAYRGERPLDHYFLLCRSNGVSA